MVDMYTVIASYDCGQLQKINDEILRTVSKSDRTWYGERDHTSVAYYYQNIMPARRAADKLASNPKLWMVDVSVVDVDGDEVYQPLRR